MAKKKDKLEAFAAHLFINEGYTLKAIADHLEISERTVGTWKKDGDWEKERTRLLAAPHTIKSILLTELEKVSKGEDSKVDADALRKIHLVIEGMEQGISPQVAMSVLKELDNWMVEQDPKLALEFTAWHKKFIIYKISLNG